MEYRTKEPENQSLFQRFGRWLSLKQYQIEVTFGVYMFTPTEKFIFCTLYTFHFYFYPFLYSVRLSLSLCYFCLAQSNTLSNQ